LYNINLNCCDYAEVHILTACTFSLSEMLGSHGDVNYDLLDYKAA